MENNVLRLKKMLNVEASDLGDLFKAQVKFIYEGRSWVYSRVQRDPEGEIQFWVYESADAWLRIFND